MRILDNHAVAGKLNFFLKILILLFIAQSIIYIFRSDTWPDEGHHFNYSLMVYRGQIPYLDFLYYQPPLFPYVYGLPQFIMGPNMYIARFTSFLFASLMLILTYKISKKLASEIAGLIAIALIILNPFSVRFFNSVSLYSLTNFLLLLAIYLIILKPKIPLRLILSVFFMTLAVATRLSMGVALAVLLIYIFITERKKPFNLISAVTTAAVTGGLIWGPFLSLAKEQTMFGNLGWYLRHSETVFRWKWSQWNTEALILNKFDAITDIVRLFPAVTTLIFVIFIFWTSQKKKISDRFIALISKQQFCLLLGILLALSVIHVFFASPVFSCYFLYLLPLASILVGCYSSKIFFNFPNFYTQKLLIVFFVVLLVINLISQGRKEVVPRLFGTSDFGHVNKVARLIREKTNENDEILTFTQHFAAQANRKIISGLEFSYWAYVPDWNRIECEKYHSYNTEILLDYIIRKKAKAVILTDLDYKMFSSEGRYNKSPEVWKLFISALNQHYHLVETITTKKTWTGKTYIYLSNI